MMKPEQVPDDVTQKVKALVIEMGFWGSPIRDFEAREIAAAAINAWPGMSTRWIPSLIRDDFPAIILPLTTEKPE